MLVRAFSPGIFPKGATDMCMIPVCVGFDYHEDSIQVCIMSQSGKTLVNRSVANSVELVIHAVSRFAREAACAEGAGSLAGGLLDCHFRRPRWQRRTDQHEHA